MWIGGGCVVLGNAADLVVLGVDFCGLDVGVSVFYNKILRYNIHQELRAVDSIRLVQYIVLAPSRRLIAARAASECGRSSTPRTHDTPFGSGFGRKERMRLRRVQQRLTRAVDAVGSHLLKPPRLVVASEFRRQLPPHSFLWRVDHHTRCLVLQLTACEQNGKRHRHAAQEQPTHQHAGDATDRGAAFHLWWPVFPWRAISVPPADALIDTVCHGCKLAGRAANSDVF